MLNQQNTIFVSNYELSIIFTGKDYHAAAEKKAKTERATMIQKEFQKRKGKLSKKDQEEKEKEKEKEEKEALRSAKVQAAEFTSKKIPGKFDFSKIKIFTLTVTYKRTKILIPRR